MKTAESAADADSQEWTQNNSVGLPPRAAGVRAKKITPATSPTIQHAQVRRVARAANPNLGEKTRPQGRVFVSASN